MADHLLRYYEREMTFLRQMGGEFATKYPKIAGRLLLDGDKCEDPHVERLIEAFAFLSGRIHKKLDDEYPEVVEGLLSTLYPHFLAPIPSMSVVQFVLKPNPGQLNNGCSIERGSVLSSPPVAGTPCHFRTCYPLTLWPIEVVSARLTPPDIGTSSKSVATIKINLRCVGGSKFADLSLGSLRFFIDGESQLTYPLYELLFNSLCEVHLKGGDGKIPSVPVSLPKSALQPVGFASHEALLPYPSRSFQGYRLLQEYFAFPQKFLFFELQGLHRMAASGFGETVEVSFHLDRLPRLEQAITLNTFRLGCTPIINLFNRIAEPIRWNHAQTEYRVVPDVRRPNSTEVYSIDGVSVTTPDMPEAIPYEPFYSFKHHGSVDQRPFWHAVRRPSERKGDSGTEMYLSLVDLDFQPSRPASETVVVHTTCTNRDLPGKLPFGGDRGDFELEGVAPPVARIRCLVKPTETLRIPMGGGLQWRLISHLSLNYVSISQGGEEALREMLALYNFSDSPTTRQQIAGIVRLSTQQVVRRLASMGGNGFCRGLQITIEFDEERYVGHGVFLFASVLEQFLGLYASINSFSQLIATSRQRKEPVKQWPPRTGAQILL